MSDDTQCSLCTLPNGSKAISPCPVCLASQRVADLERQLAAERQRADAAEQRLADLRSGQSRWDSLVEMQFPDKHAVADVKEKLGAQARSIRHLEQKAKESSTIIAGMTAKVNEARKRADAAEAACAALKHALGLRMEDHQCAQRCDGPHDDCPCWYCVGKRALATTAGSGWVSPEEGERLKEELDAEKFAHAAHHQHENEVIAKLQADLARCHGNPASSNPLEASHETQIAILQDALARCQAEAAAMLLRCPWCGNRNTHRRTSVHFEHERRCPQCNQSWEPPSDYGTAGQQLLEAHAKELAERDAEVAKLKNELVSTLCVSAKEERDSLRERIVRLEAALKPFAEYAFKLHDWPTETGLHVMGQPKLNLGHCRAAAAELTRGAKP